MRSRALTILVPTVTVDGDIAAESVLRFCTGPVRFSVRAYMWGWLIPRPLGRGETTPLRESPEGPPKAVAMNRVWLDDGLFVAI